MTETVVVLLVVVLALVAALVYSTWRYDQERAAWATERQGWDAERRRLMEHALPGLLLDPPTQERISLPPGDAGEWLKEQRRRKAAGIEDDLEDEW